ncbi:hypothetical protein Tco_0493687 [Tanacetum coccineum]
MIVDRSIWDRPPRSGVNYYHWKRTYIIVGYWDVTRVEHITDSPGYVPESDPEEEPEEDDEDPEEDPADYPADGDDDDDEDEDEDEDEEEEEEHPAPADSVPPVHRMTARISIRDEPSISLPPREEVERLLALTTPPPSPLTPLSSPLPQIPSPPPNSPTHIEIPESCLPLRKRPVIGRRLAVMIEREAKMAREAWGLSMDSSDYARSDVMSLRTTVVAQSALISKLHQQITGRQRLNFRVVNIRQKELSPVKYYGYSQLADCIDICLFSYPAMINEGVTAALAARDATRNGDDSHTSGTGVRRPVQGNSRRIAKIEEQHNRGNQAVNASALGKRDEFVGNVGISTVHRKEGTSEATTGTYGHRLIKTKVPHPGELRFCCKEERWGLSDVHRLQELNKTDSEEPLPTPPKDRRPYPTSCKGLVFIQRIDLRSGYHQMKGFEEKTSQDCIHGLDMSL